MKMRDVLYIVGASSKWEDNDLRYSLRSLEHYCYGTYNRVILVGHVPKFINRETVACLEMPEPKEPTRHWNQVRKVQRAIDHFGLDRFAWMADDIYFTCHHDIDNMPVWYSTQGPADKDGWLPDMDKAGSDGFQQYYARTREALVADGLPYRHYDGHMPVPMEAKLFMVTMRLIERRHNSAISLKAYHYNLFQPAHSAPRWDFKDDPAVDRPDFEDTVNANHAGIFSLPSKVYAPVRAWMAKKYPQMSRYEK